MSDNKFIKHLRGEDTAKSILEIKNQRTTTSFANMPDGDTSNANDVYSDHRGNATGVLKGTENWKLDGQNLIETTTVYGDGRDFTDSFSVFSNGLWVDATCVFATARRFSPNTKFVLKLCGHDLETVINHTVDFTLIVKFGTSNLISKTFTVTEQAFDFCKEFVIDFAESNSSTIKVDAGSTMQLQLLCADPSAQAVLYNGMTVFTALQRRVDGDAVASDKKTFDEVVQDIDDINDEIVQIHEDIDDLEDYVDDTFVRLDGNSIMTGPLKMRATSSFQCAIAPFWDGVGFYKLNSDDSVTLIASIETPDGFVPWVTNTYNIGSSLKKWKNLYLSGKAYVSVINNGYDIAVPVTNSADTLALKSEVDLAANSGRMITDQGVWYAKMYAATVAPSAENDTNYADFSQVDGQGNPIIVIYERQNGAWVQSETITPPAEYDGYVPITSKIWDIAEQAGQQGGRILWNHQSKEFTPYPQIISFDGQNITNSTFSGGTITNSTFSGTATLSGESIVAMPQTPTGDQIVNKDYVDNAIGNGTITITQGGTTKGTFTTNQGGNTTIDLDSGGAGHNVGDVFFTMRNDNELNGAVECDGATYNTTDFIGAESIGELLEAGKLDYISLSAYSTAISTKGWCDKIGWDGTGNTQFRVPTLNAHIVQTNNIPVVGNGMTLGLSYDGSSNAGLVSRNYDVLQSCSTAYGTSMGTTGQSGSGLRTDNRTVGITTDSTKSGIIADTTDTAQLRVMIQLATGVTDTALETCTSVLADVATLKGYDYVVEFQTPTAQNNYTWYRKYKSGWVEQGGLKHTISLNSNGYNNMIDLPITMADTQYAATAILSASYGNRTIGHNPNNSTTTQVCIGGYASQAGTSAVNWQVSGMSAS